MAAALLGLLGEDTELDLNNALYLYRRGLGKELARSKEGEGGEVS
jgi:hypothetical protein